MGYSGLSTFLDDYLIVGTPDSNNCSEHLQWFLRVCMHLVFSVAMDKVDGPATVLSFLGLELDSVSQQICLPPEKLREIVEELTKYKSHSKTTKQILLSLIGKLAFAAQAVPAGRLFIRHLITLSMKDEMLHHHIHFNSDAQADIAWWQEFLMAQHNWLTNNAKVQQTWSYIQTVLGTLGCGAYFQGEWFHHNWQLHHQQHVSIQWQELFAIVAAALTWGHIWWQKHVRFYCDNLVIVNSWEGKFSKHPCIMPLVRTLCLTVAKKIFTVSLQHLIGKTN